MADAHVLIVSPLAPEPVELFTVGQVAERLGLPLHVVRYAIDAYRIKPRMRVGILRVWSGDDLEAIAHAARRTAQNRRGRL